MLYIFQDLLIIKKVNILFTFGDSLPFQLLFSNFRKLNSNWKGKNMVEELRRVLSQHIAEIPGILALVISDKDGVPILQANTDNAHTVDACLRYQFLSSHAIVKESSKKVQ